MMDWIKRMFGIRPSHSARHDRIELVELAIAQHERRIENSRKAIRVNSRELETMRGALRLMREERTGERHGW